MAVRRKRKTRTTATAKENRRYDIIYADPPWSYRDKAHAGQRGVEYKYKSLSERGVAALDVPSIASDDAALFLWVTPPQLDVGLRVVEAWGFQYKTIAFVWIKTYQKSGKLFFGMGNWTRANAEVVLLGIRGRPKRIDAGVHQVVMSPLGAHSAKPPEVRERIVTLLGDRPRIELFARERPDGWDTWGNQVECDVDLPMRTGGK